MGSFQGKKIHLTLHFEPDTQTESSGGGTIHQTLGTRHRWWHSTNPQYDAERRHGPRLLSILHPPESLLYTTLCHQTPPSSSGTAPWKTSPFSIILSLFPRRYYLVISRFAACFVSSPLSSSFPSLSLSPSHASASHSRGRGSRHSPVSISPSL